jgi:hypothetical protein
MRSAQPLGALRTYVSNELTDGPSQSALLVIGNEWSTTP